MNASTEKFCIMLDTSGSVGGSKNYWNTINDILSLHGPQIGHFYFWNTNIEEINRKRFEQAITERRGWGGTAPELVADEVIRKNIKKIIMITDGQVSDNSVNKCDKVLEKHEFEKSICYIISSSSYGGLNMSVTCPFTRRCDNEVYEKLEEQPLKKLVQYTPADYKILDTLDEISLENFQERYETIEGLIIALNMGKDGNIPLKNQLVMMKTRLVKELSKQKGQGFDINTEMRVSLEEGNFDGAIKLAEKITKEYFSDSMTTDLEKQISHLINLCGDLRGKYNINEIKSNKMAYAKDAKEGKLDQQVQTFDLSKNPIECPIILDEDVPQILVDECEPVLLGFEKSIVDDITACPLRILNYPDVKAKVKARLSNFMGVKFADKFLKNPFTQNKLLGAIPLGTHKSHVTVGNHTIAKMMTGGKVVGNFNLYFAVIWHIIKEKEIQYLADIEKNVTEHLLFRLKTSKTMASLCGLAQFVTTELNTDLAVWYCVNSCYLNQPADRDTFRFHLYNMNPLIEITKALGYPIDKGVEQHLARTKAILSTLYKFKKLTTDEKKSFKEAVRCLYQKGIQVKKGNICKEVFETETFVKFVPIDGKADEEQAARIQTLLPPEMQNLSVQEAVFVGNLMDAQKSAADIFLDYNFTPPKLPKCSVNWAYGLTEYPPEKIHINPQTFRPQYKFKNETWEDVAAKKYEMPVKKMLKGYKYYESFLHKYNKIPTKDELILFYYNRYVIAGKVNTLPYKIEMWAENIIDNYVPVFETTKKTVKEALQIMDKSMPLTVREKMEVEAKVEKL